MSEQKDYGDYKTACTFSIKVRNKEKLDNLTKQKNLNQSQMIDKIIEEYN